MNGLSKKLKIILPIGIIVVAVVAVVIFMRNDTDKTEETDDGKTFYSIYTNGVYPGYPKDGGKAKELVLAKAEADGISGIDYKVTFVQSTDYTTRLTVLAGSASLPDIFSVDHSVMAHMQSQNLLLDLTTLADTYIPNLAKLGKKTEIDSYKIDGKLYALPSVYLESPYSSPDIDCFIIRKDWLDNLGLQMPNNITELEAVLKAFKDNDPDKNGEADTIPIVAAKTTRFQGIFGTNGIVPDFWLKRDGEIFHGSTLPEVKDVLTILNRWYTEGLIDRDYLTADNEHAMQKFQNGKAGMVYSNLFNLDPSSIVMQSLLTQVPTAEVTFLPAPEGPNGLRGYPEAPPGSRVVAFSASIQNPELAAKYINWIIDPTEKGGHMLITYGEAGKNYTLDAETETIVQTTTNPELVKLGFSNPLRWISVIDRRWMSEAARKSIPEVSKFVIPNEYSGKPQEMIDHPEIFGLEIFDEFLAKIVTGAEPVSYYDEYVSKFYQNGGTEATAKVKEILKQN